MAPHYANWPLWLDCSVGLIAQIIPFSMKAEVYLGLRLISNVALPWHAYKCLSCQLFFFLFYAALMFHADDAHTQYTHSTHILAHKQDVSLCALFGQFAGGGFSITFVLSRKTKSI